MKNYFSWLASIFCNLHQQWICASHFLNLLSGAYGSSFDGCNISLKRNPARIVFIELHFNFKNSKASFPFIIIIFTIHKSLRLDVKVCKVAKNLQYCFNLLSSQKIRNFNLINLWGKIWYFQHMINALCISLIN